MAKKRQKQDLHLYLNGLAVGTLTYKAKRDLIFSYKPEWLHRKQAFPISNSMPLQEEPYEGSKVYAYFDNLLPDGVSIRQRIAAKMHAKSEQVFDLLEVVGRDCVGALQFIKDTEESPGLKPAEGKLISEGEIANKLRNLKSFPLGASNEEDFRLSIAGAQEKTAFLKIGGQWHIPIGSAPTTHIFKPQMGEIRHGVSFRDSVENEWLCAQIVKAFKLPAANCELEEFEDMKVLIVERFDRAWMENRLIRIPQEDICQALSVPNFEKYEKDGGPSIPDIMELLNESTNRGRDRLHFMKTQVVFLLLAAIDGHAKNFSVSWRPTGFRLTPLYDVLSAQPLYDKKIFQEQKGKMAMAYGKNRKYNLSLIKRRHLTETATLSRYDAKKMSEIIDLTISEIAEVSDNIKNMIPSGFPEEVVDSILTGMQKRKDQFLG